MIKLSENDKKNFLSNGWFKTSLNLNKTQIYEYKNAALKMVNNAKKNNFSYGRIYFDYVTSYNLAAVEMPFNQEICDGKINEMFSQIKLGKAINFLLNSASCICLLNRLFCMGDYKYAGHMHQDTEKLNKRIQVMIYLKKESSFKILKKEYQSKIFIEMFKKDKIYSSPSFYLPIKYNDKYLHSIEAEEGDILFFDPAIAHQGVYDNSRLAFHMRFEKFENNNYEHSKNKDFDFKLIKDYDPRLDLKINKASFPKISRSNFFQRTLNTLNYYLPLINYLRYLKLKRNEYHKNLKFDIFDNTFYQKKY